MKIVVKIVVLEIGTVTMNEDMYVHAASTSWQI